MAVFIHIRATHFPFQILSHKIPTNTTTATPQNGRPKGEGGGQNGKLAVPTFVDTMS